MSQSDPDDFQRDEPEKASLLPEERIVWASTDRICLSLRDYFAGQALHEAADSVCDDLSDPERDGPAHAARHATAAYLLADAMLKARAERSKP